MVLVAAGPDVRLCGDGANTLDGWLEEGFAVGVRGHQLGRTAGRDELYVGDSQKSEEGFEIGLEFLVNRGFVQVVLQEIVERLM